MAFIDPRKAGDPASSPGLLALDDLAGFMPVALAMLSLGEDSGYATAKQELRQWAKRDPFDALVTTVLGGGLAFYLAERDSNPACQSPLDGILYIATSLSVGFDNLFPTTPSGHLLAAAVHTFGPALADMAFDPPAEESQASAAAASAAADEAAAVNRAILARLEDIVTLLEAQRAS